MVKDQWSAVVNQRLEVSKAEVISVNLSLPLKIGIKVCQA